MNRAAILVPLVAALLGVLGLELWPQREWDDATPISPVLPRPVQAGAPPQTALPPNALAAILVRPLFSPNRRPPALAATSPASLPRLTGVIIEGGRRTVIRRGLGHLLDALSQALLQGVQALLVSVWIQRLVPAGQQPLRAFKILGGDHAAAVVAL